jgi:hypothetical protein
VRRQFRPVCAIAGHGAGQGRRRSAAGTGKGEAPMSAEDAAAPDGPCLGDAILVEAAAHWTALERSRPATAPI